MIVGIPNVGKSTLVNALVGEKVAITSDKPQTTRSALRGIMDADGAQVVIVDTPGYHKPRNLLGRRLNEVVRGAWSDVDLAIFVVDGKAGVGTGDKKVSEDLAAARCPTFCVVNKTDAMRKDEIAVALTAASALSDFDEYVPVSARTGDTVDVHGHQVEPRRRHLHRQLLSAAAVASSKEGRFPAGFREVVGRNDAQCRGAGDWTKGLRDSEAAMRHGMNGSVHDGSPFSTLS